MGPVVLASLTQCKGQSSLLIVLVILQVLLHKLATKRAILFQIDMELVQNGKGKEISQNEISVDEIYGDLGELGLWQWGCLMGLWPPSLTAGFVILSFSFVGMAPAEFVCQRGVTCQIEDWSNSSGLGESILSNQNCEAVPLYKLPDERCAAQTGELKQTCQPKDHQTRVVYRPFDMENT